MTTAQADPDSHLDRFAHTRYMVRTKFFRLFGGAYHIYDEAGNVALYSNMKRFRLKEDIRLYNDESMSAELIRISTQSIFDFSGAYDVYDSVSDERLGTLKRAGLSSTFVRDQWEIYDGEQNQVGQVLEDSAGLGLVRRWLLDDLAFLLPQKYHAEINGQQVATFKQRINPLIMKLDVDFSDDQQQALDRRLGLATAVLLSAIEGRQE